MKRVMIITSVAACVAISLMSLDDSGTSKSMNGKAGKTNASGEGNCTSCHGDFSLNAGGGSISISSTPSLTSGTYVPGQVYTMSVTVARAASSIFGVDVECLTSSSTDAGTLAITTPTETQIKMSGSKTNVVHKTDGGLVAATKTFAFKWTAPASGSATFHASGVAGDNDGSESGDYVYATSLALTAASSTGIYDVAAANLNLDVYPNPATTDINLSYTLATDAKVTCKLFSIGGAMVSEMINENQSSGTIKRNISLPESLSKGIYFLHLSVDGKSFVKKVVIQ